ncbi:MAG TPA: hypothetical protein VG753_01770 [Candidatus Paceibacterota bacterium]|nr:hypothetical protein [Candidatus Paceibacterota bacterium]
MSDKPRGIEIEFAIYPRPDDAGLRIKTTKPPGLYLSGRDRESAEHYFEQALCIFAHERNLLDRRPNEGILYRKEIDWPACIAAGLGRATLCVASIEELMDLLHSASGAPAAPPAQEMLMKNGYIPDTGFICTVHDPGIVDGEWLLRSVAEDFPPAPKYLH